MMDRSLALDPFNPLFRAAAVFAYSYAGRYQDAIRHLGFGLEVNPGFAPFFYTKGLIEEWQGHTVEAVSSLRKACDLGGNLAPALAALGHTLAISGEKNEARRILEQLMKIPDQPAVEIATVYLGLRDEEEALKWLETGVKQRSLRLPTIPGDRRFHWIAKHSRFQAILKQMGLQAAATIA